MGPKSSYEWSSIHGTLPLGVSQVLQISPPSCSQPPVSCSTVLPEQHRRWGRGWRRNQHKLPPPHSVLSADGTLWIHPWNCLPKTCPSGLGNPLDRRDLQVWRDQQRRKENWWTLLPFLFCWQTPSSEQHCWTELTSLLSKSLKQFKYW